MAKIAITCYNCKEEFITEPYFCNTDLYYKDDGFNNSRRHIARTVANAICPRCGETNAQVCENEIYKHDIVDFAIRRYRRG